MSRSMIMSQLWVNIVTMLTTTTFCFVQSEHVRDDLLVKEAPVSISTPSKSRNVEVGELVCAILLCPPYKMYSGRILWLSDRSAATDTYKIWCEFYLYMSVGRGKCI